MKKLNNHYQVITIISQSLYGKVILCKDTYHHRLVAIKAFSLQLVEKHMNREGIHIDEDMIQEVQAHRLVSNPENPHPNILQLHETFIEEGYLYIVLEYCNQGDLFNVIDKSCISSEQAQDYSYQIAVGLQYLHLNNIAHRDLSLENVLLSDGICKICDFGLSCDANIRQNKAVGKPFYMAPEVLNEDEYDPKQADIWSFGCVLFILLTGVPVFESASLKDKRFEVVVKHGIRELLDLWQMTESISSDALDLLDSIFQANPNERIRLPQLLQHPFFQNFPKLSTITFPSQGKRISDDIIERKSFVKNAINFFVQPFHRKKSKISNLSHVA